MITIAHPEQSSVELKKNSCAIFGSLAKIYREGRQGVGMGFLLFFGGGFVVVFFLLLLFLSSSIPICIQFAH